MKSLNRERELTTQNVSLSLFFLYVYICRKTKDYCWCKAACDYNQKVLVIGQFLVIV